MAAVLFLLAGDGLGRAFAGARVGVGALSTNREPAPVTQPAVAAEIHQPLDVHGNFAPQIAFHDIVAVDHFANLQHVLVAELGHPTRWVDVHLFHDFLGLLRPDAMDILQGDHNALVCRYVNTSDTGHNLFTPVANRTRRLRLNGCKSFITRIRRHPPHVGPGIVAAFFAYWVPRI